MGSTKEKLYYHEQLRTLGEALAETLEISSEESSSETEAEDEDMTQIYRNTVQKMGIQFGKVRKAEESKDKSKPSQGFNVFLGVPKTPYHDNDCDCEVILHERGGERLCRTFYTVNVSVDETWENVYEKQQRPAFVMDGEDHRQKCDKMTEKLWIGFMRADAYHTFLDAYNRIDAEESRTFACRLLIRCVAKNILPVTVGPRAINRALKLLDELAELNAADSSRRFLG